MDELKPIFLSESLFQPKNNYDEVSYSYVRTTFVQVAGLFKMKLSKSAVGKDINVYTHGYPKMYMVSAKDYRCFPVYNVTPMFRLSDIAVKTGYSEAIVANNLVDICEDINSNNTFIRCGLYFADQNKEKLQIRAYLDNKCLVDLTSRKGRLKELSREEVNSQIKENLGLIVKAMNKDEKIKQLGSLMMTNVGDNHFYLIYNGQVLVRQISITSFYDGTFANFGIDSYSACMNVKYYLHENYLSNKDITTYGLFIDGKCFMFIGNNNQTRLA